MANFLAVLSFLFAITIIGECASILPQNIEVQMISSEDMKSVLKQYPNAIQLQSIELAQNKETRDVVMKYYLGGRISGDKLVGHAADNSSWSSPKNVQATFVYPNSGEGAIISYVEVLVQQSSSAGRAVLLSGGIGQRHVRMLVEAYNTYVFNYNFYVYGY